MGLLLLPSLAMAVGFGGISVNSKLGEPLDIDIELISATPTEIGTMEIGFASRSDFARAGVQFPENAVNLNFDIVEGLSGQYLVNISSENPVTETFLHFLIAANWSGGKVVREYTALLDPPLYSGDTASVVELPSILGSTESETTTQYTGSASSFSGEIDSTVDVVSGDTLSGIVYRLSLPDSISMFKALTALYDANPDAFIDQNMNRLKSGVTLNVPTVSSMNQVSADVARENFTAQTAAYNQFLTDIGYIPNATEDEPGVSTAATSTQDEAAVASTESAEEQSLDLSQLEVSIDLKAETDKEEAARLNIGQESTDEDIASSIEGQQGDDAQVAALKAQLAQLDESLLASGVESDEVKQRLQEIQAQVDRVSNLIEIEDSNLAVSQENGSADEQTQEVLKEALQASNDQEFPTEGDSSAEAVASTENSIENSIENGASESLPGTDSAETGDTTAATQSNSETAEPNSVTALGSSQAGESGTIQSASNDQANNQAENVAKSDQGNTATRTVASSGIMSSVSSIFGSISDYALKILAALIAIIAGLFFYRRRKSQQEFEESMLDIESGQISTGTSGDSLRQISAASGIDLASRDSGFELTVGGGMSYLSGEGVTGVAEEENEVVQSGAVDPMAEADVYLAYDRDEQAIQVLKEAYANNPERIELAEKLLEIYHKQDERPAFDSLASDLRNRIGAKHHPVWTKVVSMGREVSPDNSLYEEVTELNDLAGAQEIELDTSPMTLQSTSEASIAPAAMSSIEDVELDELDLVVRSEDSAIKALEVDDLELNFDTKQAADHGLDAPTLSQIITTAEAKEAQASMQEKAPGATPLTDDGSVDFDLSADSELDIGVSTELQNAMAEIENEKRAEENIEIDDHDRASMSSGLQHQEDDVAGLDVPLVDADAAEAREASYLNELSEQSISKMEPYHESETALELAKAYLELGEKDIAKGFIEEVINEGSYKQKAKAEQLVKELVD